VNWLIDGGLAVLALTAAYRAGVAHEQADRARKDVTGVRQILDKHVELTRERFLHTVVVLMTMNEGKDTRVVLDLLKREMEKH
jgi:hypothetical protein